MRFPTSFIAVIPLTCCPFGSGADETTPFVDVEEPVYSFQPANNGAGPMWCHGSTSIVRLGERVLITGLETLSNAVPLNNCRWFLMERTDAGWKRIHEDKGRTREPSPMAAFADSRVFVSCNPTLDNDPGKYSGPSSPEVVEFKKQDGDWSITRRHPKWNGAPRFTEHSYRSFAADADAHELIVFQNIDYTHAEWSFLDRLGEWSKQGRLDWPTGVDHSKGQPIRVCYPNVALRDRAVYFCGVSDILEPNPEWRAFKRELTGQQWDYDFRRLFFTWSRDISTGKFENWVEISSRERTAGWITPGDLWVAPNGDVHILWTERALDERLRERFFPNEKQSLGLYHAVVREGSVISRRALVLAEEGGAEITPGRGRFHVALNGDLFVVCVVNRKPPDGRPVENWLIKLENHREPSEPKRIPLKRAFTDFFTATPRAGSPNGRYLDLFGPQMGLANTMSYAQVRVE